MADKPFSPGSLAAGYFRDSGGDSQEASVGQQEAAFLAWCSQNGIVPGAVFKDQARPGSSVIGRSGFQDMMHHFRNGANEAGLVIWSYSRFARDIDDAQFFRADLRRRGYVFYSLNDEIPEGPMGRLFEAAIDWKNQQFLEDLSRDVKRGLHDLVQRYGAVPGTPPFGFKRIPVEIGARRDGRPRIVHRWVIDEEAAPRVRQAFAMRSAGASMAQINEKLHIFDSLNSYTTFFRNSIYTGTLHFGDLRIENYCDPLIDEVTWQAVQAIVQRHAAHRSNGDARHNPRRIASAYLLSGLAYCARCGSPLFGINSKKRSTSYYRYGCTRAKRKRDCDFSPAPRYTLENAVLEQLRAHVLTSEVQAAHQAAIQRSQSDASQRLEAERADLRSRLAIQRRKIANTTDAISDAGSSRALLDKLHVLEAEEGSLLSQIADIDRQIASAAPELTPAQLNSQVEHIQAILAGEDQAAIQVVLRGFIRKITVDRDGQNIVGMIEYFYPPEDGSVFSWRNPSGPPIRRHTFTIPFTAKVRKYQKRS